MIEAPRVSARKTARSPSVNPPQLYNPEVGGTCTVPMMRARLNWGTIVLRAGILSPWA